MSFSEETTRHSYFGECVCCTFFPDSWVLAVCGFPVESLLRGKDAVHSLECLSVLQILGRKSHHGGPAGGVVIDMECTFDDGT